MTRNRIATFLLMMLAVSLLSGCAPNGPKVKSVQSAPLPSPAGAYQKIDAAQAKRLMEEVKSYVLLDVRTLEEFEPAHINGAVLLPVTEIRDKADKMLTNKDAVILVYCRSGRRSADAAQQLLELGYLRVYDFGGIIDWPYEVVSSEGKGD